MTKQAQTLIKWGWYRVANGWWHTALGEDPVPGKALTMAQAMKKLNGVRDVLNQLRYFLPLWYFLV